MFVRRAFGGRSVEWGFHNLALQRYNRSCLQSSAAKAGPPRTSKPTENHGIRHPWISPRFQRPRCSRARQAHDSGSPAQYRATAEVGDAPIVISVMTVAELAHGIYRANTPERRERRRQFVDELKTHVPIHPITEATAEIIARVGGEQAAKGINLPFIDLMIGARALELGYAIGTDNTRDFGTPSGQHC